MWVALESMQICSMLWEGAPQFNCILCQELVCLVCFEPTSSWLYMMAASSSMGKVNEQVITIYDPISLNFIDFSKILTRLKSLSIPHTEAFLILSPLLVLIFYKGKRPELCTSFNLCVYYGFIQ